MPRTFNPDVADLAMPTNGWEYSMSKMPQLKLVRLGSAKVLTRGAISGVKEELQGGYFPAG